MKTSYKFWYTIQEDDVHFSEVGVRFFEGDITTKDVTIIDRVSGQKTTIPVTRYRRFKQLKRSEIKHEKNRKIKIDENGNECLIYTPKDFGVISDIDELRAFFNKILNKDKDRTPEETQSETDVSKIKTKQNK